MNSNLFLKRPMPKEKTPSKKSVKSNRQATKRVKEEDSNNESTTAPEEENKSESEYVDKKQVKTKRSKPEPQADIEERPVVGTRRSGRRSQVGVVVEEEPPVLVAVSTPRPARTSRRVEVIPAETPVGTRRSSRRSRAAVEEQDEEKINAEEEKIEVSDLSVGFKENLK